jgi:hypothetical protein
MKAVRVIAQQDGSLTIAPLPTPTTQRKGDTSAERYRQQSRGEVPAGNQFNPIPSNYLRAIRLSDGKFKGLASQASSLLTIVISGTVTVIAGPSQTTELVAGDHLLTDVKSAPGVTLDVRNQARLVQLDVAADWPGSEAEIQGPGTINPRDGGTPNLKRIYKGDDDKAYFADFAAELFPSVADQWSVPVKLSGFRMLCWENGWMDFHPCVRNQIGILGSGQLEIEVGGGGGAKQVFRAGDICLSEDTTGEGHANRVTGAMHTTNIVVDPEHRWANRL